MRDMILLFLVALSMGGVAGWYVPARDDPALKQVDDRDEVDFALRGLKPDTRDMFESIYGRNEVMKRVAKRYGVSESRVSQRMTLVTEQLHERHGVTV